MSVLVHSALTVLPSESANDVLTVWRVWSEM